MPEPPAVPSLRQVLPVVLPDVEPGAPPAVAVPPPQPEGVQENSEPGEDGVRRCAA